MNQQMNEMKYFIRTAGRQIIEERQEEPEPKYIELPPEDDNGMLDKLKEAIFKLDSFYREGSDEYMSGLQDGLNYAIDVINRIIEQSEEENG